MNSRQTKRLYEFGSFRLDPQECRLLCHEQTVPLKPKLLETLILLVENSGHMLDKDELMKRLWPDSFVEEVNLAVNISQLRKALGEGENGVRYIETVPKRGYRFVAEVREVLAESPDLILREHTRSRIVIEEQETNGEEDLQQTIDQNASSTRAESVSARALSRLTITWLKKTKGLSTIIVTTMTVGLVFAGYLINSKHNVSRRTPLKPHSLAIIPFRNLKPNTETDFLGPSMADSITNKLGHIRMLIVRPSSSAAKYRNQEIDPGAVAIELNVDKLLTGSFLKDGDDLRVTAQLIDVGANEILWRDTIDVKYDKVLAMEDRVTEEIIKGLQLSLSPAETERLKMDAPQNPLAYESFLRGRYLISSNEHSTAIKLLEESVRLDPGYALAWTYLGKAYSVTASQYFGGREFHDKAQAAYDKAIALNPQQVETRVMLANFLTENNRIDEAVSILRKVIDDNPNHPFAHWELSYAYRYAGMLDESIAEGEDALQLYAHLSGHLFNSYLYAEQYEKFLDSLPARDDAYTLFYRGLGNYYLKDWTRASFYFDRAYQLDSNALVSQLGRVLRLAMDGHNREAIDLAKVIDRKLEEDPSGDGELSYKLAECYSLLEQRAAALRLLKKSIDQGFFCYPYFLNDPLLEHVRGEAQFGPLLGSARLRHDQFRRTFF
ncbi:MAG: winged helix-turn-helix domain-containing protein [Pyrinomonadaceae bacterium]